MTLKHLLAAATVALVAHAGARHGAGRGHRRSAVKPSPHTTVPGLTAPLG